MDYLEKCETTCNQVFMNRNKTKTRHEIINSLF